jgi:hypothetical protein
VDHVRDTLRRDGFNPHSLTVSASLILAARY